MGIFTTKRGFIFISLVIIFLYISPLLFLGENAHITIHDSLETLATYYKSIAESGKIFSPLAATVPNIMGGLPRACLPSEFNVLVWLFYFFKPFGAYVINQVLMRLIGFIGMVLLLRRFWVKNSDNPSPLIIYGVSTCFALLPFWAPGGLSIAGQPLALFAFLNVRVKRDKIWDWLIISLLPFYANFETAFMFFLLGLGVLFLFDLIKTHQINYRFILSLCLMGLVFLFTEYRFFYSIFTKSFVSQAAERVDDSVTLFGALKTGLENLLLGQYHAHSLHSPIIILAVCLVLWVSIKKRLKLNTFFFLLAIIVIISLFYGFWGWVGLGWIKGKMGFLGAFNLTRFHWMHPMLWYLLLAGSLIVIQNQFKYGKQLVIVFIMFQILFLFSYNDEFQNRQGPSYKEYYSASLFQKIEGYIGKAQPSYRVVAIALDPAVVLYNGFYTIDAYVSFYPLEYKHQFRKIIAPELNKDKALKDYFDKWGSRCYLFVSEIGTHFRVYKSDHRKNIKRLALNPDALGEMGVSYIFSGVKILNYQENHLKYLRSFTDQSSPYVINLYELESSFP